MQTQSAARFWDKIAAKYARRPVGNQTAYEETLERTRSHLSQDDSVLELGCGTGTTALLLADAVGHITATDFSSEMIAIAQEKLTADTAQNVTFQQATAAADDAPANSLDAVLAFNLLHLLPDLEPVLRAANRQLKPGGLFISKTICLGHGGWKYRLLIVPMRLLGMAPHIGFLKISDLEQRIAAQGFKIIETGNYPAKPPSRFIVARKL
ncbi:class I SAM-dependent methyltransferase [Arenibacterium sp. CAU 1754]